MANRREVIALGEFYHIYTRGVDKRQIFLDDADRRRFLRLLFLCNGSIAVEYRKIRDRKLIDVDVGEKLVAIGAYCLMSNHFHLLIKEVNEGGITKFMSKLLTSYSSYFNKKYERTGALFGSRFKSSHLDSDEYLKYIFAYIHLNPLKVINQKWQEEHIAIEVAKDYLSKYGLSSYLDYVQNNMTETSLILNKSQFPEYFQNVNEFEKYIYDWIKFDPDYQGPPLVKLSTGG